jgi:hypothetical protein
MDEREEDARSSGEGKEEMMCQKEMGPTQNARLEQPAA